MTDTNIYGSSPREAEAGPRDGLAEATEAVKAEAAHFAAAAGDKAQEKVAEGQAALGGGIGQFADALRQAGADLDQRDQSLVSGLVKQAADGLESVARGVADKRPEELLHAVRDFGRKNPTALIAVSVLAGVALGRLARASGERGHAQTSGASSVPLGAGDEDWPASLDQAKSVDPGQPGDEASRTPFGVSPATSGVAPTDRALTDTESLSVLGIPDDAGSDEIDSDAGYRPALREDREI